MSDQGELTRIAEALEQIASTLTETITPLMERMLETFSEDPLARLERTLAESVAEAAGTAGTDAMWETGPPRE